MALKKSIDFKGILVSDAYIKIAITTILPGNEQAEVHVHYLASSEGVAFLSEGFQFVYDLNGANPIVQAYNHLKTLEAFAGAEDC